MTDAKETTPSPSDRWEALKRRGNFTVAEIDAIDADTRWQPVEPGWWLEMMAARQAMS